MPQHAVSTGKYVFIPVSPESFVNMDFGDIRIQIQEQLVRKQSRIGLEFSGGTYLYSRVAAFLVECYRLVKEHGGLLSVISQDPYFIKVLQTTQLDRMVPMVSSRHLLD